MYRWVDHTAEVELEIEANAEREVFADALRALAELIGSAAATGATDAQALESRPISVTARERATQLAGWLEELVYLAESEGFVALRLTALELGGDRLEARVEGVVDAPPPLVKAVTLHGLLFDARGDGYIARVVLDV